MKHYTFILLFFCIHSFCSAQLNKSNWLIGGNTVFNTGSYTAYNGDKVTNSTITFAPGAGYFLADKLPVGIRAQITGGSNTVKPAVGSSSAKTTTASFDIGPFARYYFLRPDNKYINVFLEANYGWGSQTYSYTGVYKEKYSSHHYGVLAGPVIFFNNSIGLELSIGYYSSFSSQYNENTTGIQAGIGLQIYLGKEKQ